MDDITILLVITLLAISFPIILLIYFIIEDGKSRQKQGTIKDYIEDYLKQYNNYQSIELDSKIKKVDHTLKISKTFWIVLVIFTIIFIYLVKFIIRMNFMIGFVITVVFVFTSFMVSLSKQKLTIKKIVLNNNMIKLYTSHGNIETYQLEEIDIKYNIISVKNRYGRIIKWINIFFNNDKYTSMGYSIYNFETYIAFIILVNNLKRNDIQNIENLKDEEIEKLQQKFIYSEV